MMLAQEVPSLPRGVRVQYDSVREKWVLLAPERAVTLDQIGHARERFSYGAFFPIGNFCPV